MAWYYLTMEVIGILETGYQLLKFTRGIFKPRNVEPFRDTLDGMVETVGESVGIDGEMEAYPEGYQAEDKRGRTVVEDAVDRDGFISMVYEMGFFPDTLD